ncbi:RNA polymerase sigma factor [Paenibacillus paeoniae]|uniref:RNA polymerase sigma factor n=1 Tax=Paenibacillus paeoniae TaxID=2292705 RepID=A0A371PL59_9BACL|nr:RNA polymerase sigma factor [Paenibacillus paeoniae]REK76950.1 RNA polymerase sigma factor [Paenibacillus paeoniae]
MQTDEELIEEIKRGSPSAMEVLIKRHYNLVFAYLYRSTGDYHLACDLTQDTFMKLVKFIGDYTSRGSFKPWLLRIALNTCRDYMRSSTKRTRLQTQEVDDSLQDPNAKVIDLIEQKQESNRIRHAIMELPPYQREALVLRYYHDYKIKHIAEITSSGESAVKSRISQGLAKLKSILNRRGGHEQKRSKG